MTLESANPAAEVSPADDSAAPIIESSPPRRLGLLKCPNAASLGWGGGTAAASANNGLAAPTPTEPVEDRSASSPIMTISDVKEEFIIALQSQSGDTKQTPDNDMDLSSHYQQNGVSNTVHENSESASSRKRSRLLSGETEELMKGGGDDGNNYYGPALTSAEPSSSSSTSETKPSLPYLSVTLDYEPNISTSESSSKSKSQILTVTHNRGCDSKGTTSTTTVVGTISGRARIELLPTPVSENNDKTSSALSSSGLSLDIFGYRLSHTIGNNPMIINRPDWMNALPISVVFRQNNVINQETCKTFPTVLRVRITSLANENKNDTGISRTVGMNGGGDECYYSAYPEESYQLNILPSNPAMIHPGNYTAAGPGVCTILEPWQSTIDKIVDEMLDSAVNDDDGRQAKRTEENHNNRILLCGAKGVGKSTLLRYATNRILSTPSSSYNESTATSNSSSSRRCPRRVAILDLDCGQSELSPPGMLSLTIVSKPLLSDPPMHMICGGSCDHYGRKIGQTNQNEVVVGQTDQNEEDSPSVKHEAAYFFGDITSKSDPDTYIQMASQLMQQYHALLLQKESEEPGEENKSLPLLVNTDGWVKGLGYEILSAIIGSVVNPGHVIQIMGSSRAKQFDMHPHTSKLVHVIQSFDESLLPSYYDDSDANRSRRSVDSTASSSTGTLLASASDHRIHRLCAYFLGGYKNMLNLRSPIPGDMDEGISFHKERGLHDPNNVIGMTLASMRPYAVPFHSVQVYPPLGLLDGTSGQRCWGVNGNLASNDVLESLNGSIVGLCCKPGALHGMPLLNYNAGTGVPILNCIGLGIIRSIDHARQIFCVLTPVHPRLLVNVNSLVGGGNINLPLECVFRGVHSESFGYLSCGTHTNASTGADVMKSRNHSRGKK